jgi:hypothetical protein
MKITKKDLDEHLRVKAAHHQAKKEQKLAHASLHKSEEERCSISDPAQAQYHRNKASVYKSEASSHANVQEHYQNIRERLAASPDSHVDRDGDVIDEHGDASRNLQSVAGHDSFLKRVGLLD